MLVQQIISKYHSLFQKNPEYDVMVWHYDAEYDVMVWQQEAEYDAMVW